MGGRGRTYVVAVVVVFAALVAASPAGAYVYWANQESTIGRANLDGTAVNDNFITDDSTPLGVAVDGQHIYWANYGTSTIGRADLDGTHPDQTFTPGLAYTPWAVAVDGRHIYWATNRPRIGRANLDGTAVNEDFIAGAGAGNSTIGVAVDGQHIYWANGYNTGGGTIGRADLDGTNANPNFITGTMSPRGVAVDGQHIYWADESGNTIGRADLDGTHVDERFVTGATDPLAVAVDGRHLYWAGYSTGTIGRANLDGTNADQDFIISAGFPMGVAVDAGPPGTAVASASSLRFPTEAPGSSSAPQTLTVTNRGHGADLHVGQITVTGSERGDFSIAGDGCSRATLAIGASCAIDLRFHPSASGPRAAALSVPSDDPASPLRVALSGVGATPPAPPASPSPPVLRAPGAGSGRARHIHANSVQLTGWVNPNGQSTRYRFRVYRSHHRGHLTSARKAGAGTSRRHITVTVRRLETATRYHYRLIATSTAGTARGRDRHFTTRHVCVVPKLRHKTLVRAKELLKQHHCALGHVKRPRKHHHGLQVSHQSRHPGSRHPARTRVNVTLHLRAADDRRRRPRH